MFYLLISVLIFLLIAHYVFNCNKDMKLIRKIPGSKEYFFMGNFLEVAFKIEKYRIQMLTPAEIFKLLRSYADKHSSIYTIWALGIKTVNIYNPNDVEIILSTMKHHEKSITYNLMRPWLRDGLLLSTGKKWHHRRKILTKAFSFTTLQDFCSILEENSRRFEEILESTKEEPIDVRIFITDFTLHSICETAMGTKLHKDIADAGTQYKNAIHSFGYLFVERLTNMLIFDFMLYLTPIGRKTRKTVEVLQSFSRKVIKERKEQSANNGKDNCDDELLGKKRNTAMLDLLISAEKEGTIDSVGIQEEVDTFMFEGHDTSACALIYCFMLLANHKEVQDKVYQELKKIFGDSTNPASIGHLSKLRYLECCIKEALRLYPPVPFIGRRLSETTTLSNYTVPAGTYVQIHIYDLHRREDLFENASVFDPERFLPEYSFKRHPYAYIPFSAGPRNCIGQKLAMLEMKSCLAGVLRKFELRAVTRPEDLEFTADLVLRNSKPVLVQFKKRK